MAPRKDKAAEEVLTPTEEVQEAKGFNIMILKPLNFYKDFTKVCSGEADAKYNANDVLLNVNEVYREKMEAMPDVIKIIERVF